MPPTSDRVCEVRLALPARPDFVQVARLTVTAVASRIGFSYDEIEDLRIAVSEVCGLLVAPDLDTRLTVRVETADGRVTIDVERAPSSRPIEVPELTDRIMRAVVDDVSIDTAAGRVTMTKHRQD